MAQVQATLGAKTKTQDYNALASVITRLPDDLFCTHIFLCMCLGASPKDEDILSCCHRWRQVSHAWKGAVQTNSIWHAFQVNNANVSASNWPNGENIDAGQLAYNFWTKSMVALRYKEEGNQPPAHLERKSLSEFIQFRNLKNLLVMNEGADYYDESPLGCECEVVSRVPCFILKDVMHGEEETKCVPV
jgi:hypothetical protein